MQHDASGADGDDAFGASHAGTDGERDGDVHGDADAVGCRVGEAGMLGGPGGTHLCVVWGAATAEELTDGGLHRVCPVRDQEASANLADQCGLWRDQEQGAEADFYRVANDMYAGVDAIDSRRVGLRYGAGVTIGIVWCGRVAVMHTRIVLRRVGVCASRGKWRSVEVPAELGPRRSWHVVPGV